MNTRTVLLTLILAACVIGACTPTAPTAEIPTLANLPSVTPAPPSATVMPPENLPPMTPAGTPEATLIAQVVATDGPSTQQMTLDALVLDLTRESAELSTGIAGATNDAATLTAAAITATPSATETPTDLAFITFTPSHTLDVTYTPYPTRTATPTPTPLPNGLELLALLSAQFTVLPPEIRYNEATRTGLAVAVTAAVQTAAAMTANPGGGQPIDMGTPITGPGGIILATLPPPISGGGSAGGGTTITCAAPPPATISSLLASEPALASALGCPIGTSMQVSAATQTFERGNMIYMAGSPGDIFALTSDTRFRRVPDTWTEGVDPDSMGLTPPSANLLEPRRGFGKVWRTYPDLQASIGWATAGESGTNATLLLFEHGRAIYVPSLNQTFVLIQDAGATDFGTWRTVIGSF